MKEENYKIITYELSLKRFINKLKKKEYKDKEEVKNAFEEVIGNYINENIVPNTDLKYNQELTKNLLAEEDLSDIFEKEGEIDEYTVRKNMRDIMKAYLLTVDRTHKFKITNKQKFGFHLESIGLTLGFNNDPPEKKSLIPDGNVIVLTFGLLAALFITMMKK